MGYEFDGVRYEKLRDMRETRRARYVGLFEAGMNFRWILMVVATRPCDCMLY